MTVKGSEQPLKLYTCDVDVEAIPVPTQEEILSGRSYEDETNSFQLSESFLGTSGRRLVRKRVSEEFLTDFERAFQKYERGEWNEAGICFKNKKRVSHNGEEIEDGPTKSLLAVMERTNYRAPNDWSGFRALTKK